MCLLGFNSIVLRALGIIQEDLKQILRNQNTLAQRPRPTVNVNVTLPINSKEDFYKFNIWLIENGNRESLVCSPAIVIVV